MVLAPPGSDVGPQLRPRTELAERGRRSSASTGHTATPLRPAGKAQIDGDYLDVFSDGPFIDAGTPSKSSVKRACA